MAPTKFTIPRSTAVPYKRPRMGRPPKERPANMSPAEWARDVKRREAETQGRRDRETKRKAKLAAQEAAAAAAATKGFPPPNGAQFHATGLWANQSGASSPATPFSPSSPVMFSPSPSIHGPSRFSPSPDPPDNLGGFNPNVLFHACAPPHPNQHRASSFTVEPPVAGALRRGPLPLVPPQAGASADAHQVFGGTTGDAHHAFGGTTGDAHQVLGGTAGEEFMQDLIAGAPGFYTQEESRAAAEPGLYSQELADGEAEEDEEADEPARAKGKKRERVKAEPRVKWATRENECLADAWMSVRFDPITGANQSHDNYWKRVKLAFDERKICDPYFKGLYTDRGEKAMANHWATVQQACSKWHGIQEEIEARPVSGESLEGKFSRVFDAYRDDNKADFKFLHVFTQITQCAKWKEVRLNLAKGKDGVYNPDDQTTAAADGRPQGQKKAKAAKAMAPSGERLQSAIEQCMADAKARAVDRGDKFDQRWREMKEAQDAKLGLLKVNVTAKKRNHDFHFLMGGSGENMAAMDPEFRAWFSAERAKIFNDIRESTPTAPPSSSSTPTAPPEPSRVPTDEPVPVDEEENEDTKERANGSEERITIE